ncbi:MAG: hypothetical protein JTJ24_01210 [Collinsella sp.]|nr:hypothetical protein [Collinsella sp.]
MSKTIVKPTLSLGNHIYLYRLLRDAIGCGKQTFMTQVEEALAAGDMAACDLGFESTRELLEELDDCIKLTVFKGGRLYATVIANEAWDAALAKGEGKPKAAKGAKQSYKKKKRGEKDLKAVRPKHVKRPEPESAVEVEAAPEPEVEVEVVVETAAEIETEIAATADSEVTSEQEVTETPEPAIEEPADQPETHVFQNSDVFGDDAEDGQPDETVEQGTSAATPEPEAPQPAISLTVVYDPENANAGITTMASTPVEAKPSVENESTTQSEVETAVADTPATVEPADSAAKPEATTEPAPTTKPVPAPVCDQIPAPAPTSVPAAALAPEPAAPSIPEDFPVDFATEVFCPGPLLHQLSTYLPYGADTLGIVGEYYWIARERGTIEAARNRASFPLRYTQAGERHEVTVRIRRNTTCGLGAAWTIDKVEEPAE